MATASTMMTVEVTFSESDRALLQNILYALEGFGQDKPGPEPSEDVAPSSDEDKEQFKALAEAAYDKAKSLLGDKENKAANAARIQAILKEIGVEKVSAITTVEQAEQFLAALDS